MGPHVIFFSQMVILFLNEMGVNKFCQKRTNFGGEVGMREVWQKTKIQLIFWHPFHLEMILYFLKLPYLILFYDNSYDILTLPNLFNLFLAICMNSHHLTLPNLSIFFGNRYGFLNENIRASLAWLGRHLTHKKCCKVPFFLNYICNQ